MQDIIAFIQHHLTLGIMLVVVLILLVILEFIKIRRGAKRCSPQRAIQLINHENATVIDIRNAEAFANGHIINSLHLPLRDILEKKLKKIEKLRAQPLLIVCARGADSTKAAEALDKAGFNTHIIEGGIFAWQQASLPLMKD